MTSLQSLITMISTPSELKSFHAELSFIRFQLAYKLYEMANMCYFTIKLDIFFRAVFHLKFTLLTNYNIKPKMSLSNVELSQMRQQYRYLQKEYNSTSSNSTNNSSSLINHDTSQRNNTGNVSTSLVFAANTAVITAANMLSTVSNT